MSAKSNPLIVGDYNRRDFVDLFKACRNSFNFYFLKFASPQEVLNTYYRTYGTAIYWGDFKHAQDLLDRVKPHKVLFFFVESYFHVILNLTCKLAGVPTYHIDHGIRDVNINIKLEKYFINQKGQPSPLRYAQKIRQFLPRLKARLFLYNSVRALPQHQATFFQNFYKIRKSNHYLTTFKLVNSPFRVTDAYISFSAKIYEVHKEYDYLNPKKVVHFTGLPFYDHLATINPAFIVANQILYLDQGLATREILGWTAERYSAFILKLTSICVQYGFNLFVKLHPIQLKEEEKIWAEQKNVTLIDNTELTALLPSTSLIIGFFSTYLLPLIAMPHTTVLTLENHPAGRLDVSKSFIDAGVAKPVYDLEELHEILPNIEKLHQQQLPNKAKFTEEWMYKFDGKAGERLRDILLSNEL